MSVSQYKSFMSCEAKALAEVQGKHIRESNDAFLVGSYVHAGIEGTIDAFKVAHPEMFTMKGELKAPFKHADKMIETLKTDEFVSMLLDGEHETIVTFQLFGVQWKAMLDIYNPKKKRVVELKTTKSITEGIWSKDHGGRVSFIEAYNYMLQTAIYAVAYKSIHTTFPEMLMVAVSKEDQPDKAIINVTDLDRWDAEFKQVQENLPHIMDVKEGRVQPTRCEKCDYCRKTKKLSKIIPYNDLILD